MKRARSYVLLSGGRAYRASRGEPKIVFAQPSDVENTDNSEKAQTPPERPQKTVPADDIDYSDEHSGGARAIIPAIKLPRELDELLRAVKSRLGIKQPQYSGDPNIPEGALYGAAGRQEPLFLPRTKPKSFVLSVFFRTLAVMFLSLVVLGFCGLGAGLGMIKAYVDTTPELEITLIESQAQTSLIFDKNGKMITTFAGTENREWVNYEAIPDMLKNAFIAVEDVRFFKHDGVDFKRLGSAIVSTLSGSGTHGGSTITQQLIKNRVLSSEQSYRRKIQEAYLALELEKQFDKEQILEAYLNAIPLGGINYGVKAAAMDYFAKDLDELTVRECAMLAGLTQNPTRYNPRTNKYSRPERWEWTRARTDTVLLTMYTNGFISQEQYNAALAEDVFIIETSKARQMYDMPYFVEYAIYDVITHMLRAENLQDNKANRSAMENRLRTGGYRIYTTVDPSAQNTVQQTLSEYGSYPPMRDPSKAVSIVKNRDGTVDELPQPQAATVVADKETGEIRALVGGRDEPPRLKLLNRAYQSRVPVGSSIKPLSVYGPALDSGAGTGDVEYNFAAEIDGYGGENGYPRGGLTTQDVVTLREGLVRSLNVVAARLLFTRVGVANAVAYLQNLGVEPSAIKADGPGLSLGTSGISPLEMTAAYLAIANGGTYQELISFTKVTDSNGDTVLDAETNRVRRQVFKPSTSYMLTHMLQNAVRSGTGTKARITGVEVAGKTGTNDDYRSVYFAGFTPYYVSALWIGHDDYSPQLKSGATGGTYAAPLWQAYMAKLHEGLAEKKLLSADPSTAGVVSRRVCTLSGRLATDACEQDSLHKPANELFAADSAPTEKCALHAAIAVCSDSSQFASANCPQERTTPASVVLIPSTEQLYDLPRKEVSAAIPNAHFGVSTVEELAKKEPERFCRVHSSASAINSSQNVISSAQSLLNTVSAFLSDYGSVSTYANRLYSSANALQNAIASAEPSSTIQRLADDLKTLFQTAVADLT